MGHQERTVYSVGNSHFCIYTSISVLQVSPDDELQQFQVGKILRRKDSLREEGERKTVSPWHRIGTEDEHHYNDALLTYNQLLFSDCNWGNRKVPDLLHMDISGRHPVADNKVYVAGEENDRIKVRKGNNYIKNSPQKVKI